MKATVFQQFLYLHPIMLTAIRNICRSIILVKFDSLAEFGDLYIKDASLIVHAHEHVIQVEITMHDSILMQIVDGAHNLLVNLFDLSLIQLVGVQHQIAVQAHVLLISDEIKEALILVKVDELEDIRMI